ncbi:MAG: magnesium-translocating P-type ATPase [Pseudomonadota bacterium]
MKSNVKSRNLLKSNELSISPRLIESSKNNIDDALKSLETSQNGLNYEEVLERREKYGLNEVAHERPDAWYRLLADSFINPFIGVLAALILVSFFTDVIIASKEERSFKTIIVLFTMISVSAILRFLQEYRSGRAAEQLKAMVRTTATVVRLGHDEPQEISITELVPGDIVRLSAGDMIPADVRVLSSRDLFISQAILTGESIPLEKHDISKISDSENLNPLEFDNICFMGTNVVTGSATVLVVATGSEAYLGTMARDLSGKRALTSFDIGINKVSWVLIRFMFIMVPIVFLINGLTKGNWFEALLFSVSVAVGLTPEMLPMVVTANLARGAVAMAKRKTIVKRLNSIQNFGAMDILCTDKTGTLTQDKIILERHLDIYGRKNIQVLKYAYLNSYYQTGLKNVLDVALISYGKEHDIDNIKEYYNKIDEIPFDFVRRRMSVIVRHDDGRNLLVCKGAVEEVLSLCVKADELDDEEENTITKELDSETRKEIRSVTKELNTEGLRVLAVAYKWLPSEERTYTIDDESDMILGGYVAFLDPPKETARTAIKALGEHGVSVKIITGDNEIVTSKICRDVGLDTKNIIMGQYIDSLSDEELANRAEETTIFAKMSPVQKSRIIRALQSKGHTVGYMGDGINDASALRDADVGISVDTAVDIAKESADIVLLEKSLMVLEEGVIEGRKTFGNIMKYIKMTASSNFGNVFSVLIASAFLPFLPMLAVQLLVQNLLYDISQISIPWDNVDSEYMEKPRKWEAGGIVRFMMFIGPISSLFDVFTFYLMWHFFAANNDAMQGLFQSGWFVEGLLSQTLIVHMIRTHKVPFFGSRAATPVILLTACVMLIGMYIPFSALGSSIGLKPLPFIYFPILLFTLLGYCTITQIVKNWYFKKFGEWI